VIAKHWTNDHAEKTPHGETQIAIHHCFTVDTIYEFAVQIPVALTEAP